MILFLQVSRVRVILYFCAISVIISSTSSTSANFTQTHFQLQPNPRRGPVRLGPPWIDKSRTSCAQTCTRKHRNCTSFLFNPHTGLCTPGAYINEKQPLPSPAEGDFFQSFYCDTSKGFSVKIYGNTVACVALFGPATYYDADADCQSKGVYLMSVKAVEKNNILVNISRNNNTWIGCDDLLRESEFVWKDDGEKLTDRQIRSFFLNGDPNDVSGDEDCVQYSHRKTKLFDTKCSSITYYVCEMPYPISFIISSTSSTSANFTQTHFQLQPNRRRGPVRLGPPWIDKSRISCAQTCTRKHRNCTSFLFNPHTGLCTPGAYINEKQPLPSSAEGDFFQSFYCDTSKGFSVKTYGNTAACVGLFGLANYTIADDDCQRKGAYLMSVKTGEKYTILVNISTDNHSWIGCDDLHREGKFLWKDDGEKLTAIQIRSFFVPGDPNDGGRNQDCVLYDYSYTQLVDSTCSQKNYYVCEMPYR